MAETCSVCSQDTSDICYLRLWNLDEITKFVPNKFNIITLSDAKDDLSYLSLKTCKQCRAAWLHKLGKWITPSKHKHIHCNSEWVDCDRCKFNGLRPNYVELAYFYELRALSKSFQLDRDKYRYFISLCHRCRLQLISITKDWIDSMKVQNKNYKEHIVPIRLNEITKMLTIED